MNHFTEEEMQRAREEVATYGRVLTQGERVIADRRKVLARHGKLFLSADGAELLDGLQKMYYDCDQVARLDSGVVSVEDTFKNLGAREVVRYLMDLRDSAKKET